MVHTFATAASSYGWLPLERARQVMGVMELGVGRTITSQIVG